MNVLLTHLLSRSANLCFTDNRTSSQPPPVSLPRLCAMSSMLSSRASMTQPFARYVFHGLLCIPKRAAIPRPILLVRSCWSRATSSPIRRIATTSQPHPRENSLFKPPRDLPRRALLLMLCAKFALLGERARVVPRKLRNSAAFDQWRADTTLIRSQNTLC